MELFTVYIASDKFIPEINTISYHFNALREGKA